MLTVKQVAERLNVSQSCVYQLVERRQIPHHRIGLGRGAIRFTEDDVSQFLRRSREEQVQNLGSRSDSQESLKHLKL
jgi:excisionase family DNA binding protein